MLSHTTGYAVKALAFLASKNGQPTPVREISERTAIPAPYLGKIIHTLARKHLVVTRRGIGGGVSLAQPTRSLTLYDVCIALGDPLVEERCMLGIEACSDERACPTHAYWTGYRQQQVAMLKWMTLETIGAFENRRSGA